MVLFKQGLKEVNGLAYVFDHIEVCSALGRTRLLNQPFLTSADAITAEHDKMEHFMCLQTQHPTVLQQLIIHLHDLNDIKQTIQNIQGQHVVDDIELFEIKKLAFTSQKIRTLLQGIAYEDILLHDLSHVWQLLDPEKTQIPHFYIYAAYDERLAPLRKEMQNCTDPNQQEQLSWEISRIEDSIRQRLSTALQPFATALADNLAALATLDLLQAKCKLMATWNWCKPSIATTHTRYSQLVQPEVQALVTEEGGRYQAIDIELKQNPCLITGANMSGKTVLLKSLYLAQYLFQTGFYVPAQSAEITVVEQIFCIIDDRQNERQGLSSFAVELMNIHNIISTIKQGVKCLVLVDELARTTNPEEGRRFVNAFVKMMQQYAVMALVTTHYGNIPANCRRLRVKGLSLNVIPQNITPKALPNYMDYALEETDSTDVPNEAIHIAEIFHIDAEFLELVKEN